jgi:GR25 family glycosyltransferase involved in LPS biosynthesis
MEKKLQTTGIHQWTWIPSNPLNSDPRIQHLTPGQQPYASLMWNGLDCMEHFLKQTTSQFCIVMEDDIHLKKTFLKDLPLICQDFEDLNLDILLLGYLLNCNPSLYYKQLGLTPLIKSANYSYFDYGENLWGTQMWMVSRNSAPKYLSKFTMEEMNSGKIPWSPDWCTSKYGQKACIYPMLGVENGESLKKDPGQVWFHQQCHLAQYDANLYV